LGFATPLTGASERTSWTFREMDFIVYTSVFGAQKRGKDGFDE
jgi:hypothetical protein